MQNKEFKTILGIETSCDETAAAVLQKTGDRITILSNIVASSADLQAKYGGVIPEQAAREQLKSIIPVIEEAISRSRLAISQINAIAVTYGPGLIGSLLVGVETAKTLSLVWNKPLIPVNHLIGHFYANWISHPRGVILPSFPCIGLLVSGGHTDLVLFKNHGEYEYLGGTRDDAAGECFDKCARLLGLSYPGGPQIAKLASQGNALKFKLPRPMIDSKNFDFSFSGLKTAVANLLKESSPKTADLAAAIQQAIIDVLIKKSVQAVQKYKVKNLILAGGVTANQNLASELKLKIKNLKLKISGACDSEIFKLHVPSANLCTDNAAMIATAAFFQKPLNKPLTIQADPNLALT